MSQVPQLGRSKALLVVEAAAMSGKRKGVWGPCKALVATSQLLVDILGADAVPQCMGADISVCRGKAEEGLR